MEPLEMNPVIREEWVRRLRSRKYRQGRSVLTMYLPPQGGRLSLAVQWVWKYRAFGEAWQEVTAFMRRLLSRPSQPRHCCLGVLCVIAEEKGIVTSQHVDGAVTYNGAMTLLPAEVMAWAGLDRAGPQVMSNGGYPVGLATANDNGVTFKVIADAIAGDAPLPWED